jgi:hypothetical protein
LRVVVGEAGWSESDALRCGAYAAVGLRDRRNTWRWDRVGGEVRQMGCLLLPVCVCAAGVKVRTVPWSLCAVIGGGFAVTGRCDGLLTNQSLTASTYTHTHLESPVS